MNLKILARPDRNRSFQCTQISFNDSYVVADTPTGMLLFRKEDCKNIRFFQRVNYWLITISAEEFKKRFPKGNNIYVS